jgi:uncharacterized membrane protein YbhN (UPF0104 family)
MPRLLSRWLEARRHQATATDAQATRLRGARLATGTATLSFLGAWCLEALESALLLHLVGARVDLSSVFALEAGLSLVRSAVVLAPSGLGVVDLGYATVLQALGADPGAAAAFVLLKRGKEAVWVAAGYGLLALLRAPQSSPSTSTSRRPASSTLTGNVRRWAHSVASGLPVVRSNAKP